MRRHFLRVLERAAVCEVGGDPGGAEPVTTDFRRDDTEALTKSKFRLNRYGRSMGCIEMGRLSCSYCFMYSTRIVKSFIFVAYIF